MALSKIITEEALPKIQQALTDLEQLDRELALAERAGLRTGPTGEALKAIEKQAGEAKATLLAIKQAYFPGA